MTHYKPLVSIIKEALMKKCNHIQNQPLPCQILKEPLNPRTYTQNDSPAMVQEGEGGVHGTPPQSFCYDAVFRSDFAFTETPLIFLTR